MKKNLEPVNLEGLSVPGSTIEQGQLIKDVFFKISDYSRTQEKAYFNAKLCTMDGEQVRQFRVLNKDYNQYRPRYYHSRSSRSRKPSYYESHVPDTERMVNEAVFSYYGIQDFIKLIQTGKVSEFSKVTMFAQERTVQYKDGEPHYFLDLILGEPGKKTKLSSAKKVKACTNCDTMLLRFSYDWSMQRDDFTLDTCPYCNQPLKITERVRKYVPVELDFKAGDCKTTGTNNQIGILYKSIPVKATVKVKALFNFFLNFQEISSNKILGPFDITLNISKSKRTFIEIVEQSVSIDRKVQWREVILYPEDLIAF